MAKSAARIPTFEDVTSEGSALHFDRREMLIVHNVFRREFALMMGLVATVVAGNRDRARLVGDHIDALTSLLHRHHAGEDAQVWPLLMDRCPHPVAALTGWMHDQHKQLAANLDAVSTALGVWRVDAAARSGDRLIEALDQTLASLRQHLDDEERHLLPLLERYVTAAEWDEMVQKGAADAAPAELPLAFGMLMYEGDPEIIERALGAMPSDVRPVLAELAPQTFAEHSRAVHGTPTPPRSTELTGIGHD